MSQVRATHLEKPEVSGEFERAILAMAQHILPCGDLSRFGRSGQAQHGIDHEGYINDDPSKPVVLQSKCRNPGKAENPDDIRVHVEACVEEGIEFTRFIYVTSADRDNAMAMAAKEVTKWLRDEKGISATVRVWDWGYIQDRADADPVVRAIFDPTFVSRDDQLSATIARVGRETRADVLSGVAAEIERSASITRDLVRETTPASRYEAAIDVVSGLIGNDDARAKSEANALLDKSDLGTVDRSRLLGTLGNIALNADDEEEAASYFEAAYSSTPDRGPSAANFALALGLTNRLGELEAFARDQIPKHPDQPLLAIRCAIFLKDLDLIPPHVQSTYWGSLARIEHIKDRVTDAEYLEAVEEAYALHPDNTRLKSALGAAILAHLASQRPFNLATFWTAEEVGMMERARDLLAGAWQEATSRSGQGGKVMKTDAINLTVAHRMLRNPEAAVDILQGLQDRFGATLEVKQRLVSALSEAGRDDEAALLISELPETADTVRFKLGRLQLEQDWGGIVDLLEANLDRIEESEKPQMEAFLEIARIQCAPLEDRKELVDEALNDLPDHPVAMCLYYQLARIEGRDEAADSILQSAKELVVTQDNDESRLIVAQHLSDNDDTAGAIELLLSHVAEDVHSDGLHTLLVALAHEQPPAARGRRVFRRLPTTIAQRAEIRELKAVLEFNHGRIEHARRIWSSLFQDNPSLDHVAKLLLCAARLNDIAGIKSLVEQNGLTGLPGLPMSRLQVAAYALRMGYAEAALELGLQAVRRGHGSPRIASNYTFLVLTNQTPVNIDTTVRTGSYVRFESDGAGFLEGLVGIESAPWGNQLPATNAVLSAALGLKEGDAFKVKGAFGQERDWTVALVQPEWLRAARYLTENHETRFGNRAMMASLHIGDEPDFSPLIEQIHETGRAIDIQCDLVAQKRLPLRFVAQGEGGAVGLAQQLRDRGRSVPTCFGLVDPLREVITIAEDAQHAKDGVVIDMLTAVTAYELGHLDTLRQLYGRIRVPEDDVVDLEGRLSREDKKCSDTFGLQSIDGKIYKVEQTAAERQASIDEARTLVATIRRVCEVETVVFPDASSPVEDIIRRLSPETVAPYLLAEKYDIPLLSEDGALRDLARNERLIDGIWLQPSLMVAWKHGIIEEADYYLATARLMELRHGFVFLTVGNLVGAASMGGNALDSRIFEVLAGRLGDEDISQESCLSVAVEALKGILNRRGVTIREYQQADIILQAVARGMVRPGAPDWADAMGKRLSRNARRYFRQWRIGHFL